MTTACILALSLSSFAHCISQLLLSPKCQLCYQYLLETQLHLLLHRFKCLAPGADLGADVCTNYWWLIMLRTHSLGQEYSQICYFSPWSSSISINVVSDLTSQIFISHIIEKHLFPFSVICLSFSFSLSCILGHRKCRLEVKEGIYLLDLTLGEERQRIKKINNK